MKTLTKLTRDEARRKGARRFGPTSGTLAWNTGELHADRYGAISLHRRHEYEGSPAAPVGEYGKLCAEVLNVDDPAIYDMGYGPQRVEEGDIVVLGEGTVFVEGPNSHPAHDVGVRPVDGRATYWLDHEALRSLRNQRCRLLFIPEQHPTQE